MKVYVHKVWNEKAHKILFEFTEELDEMDACNTFEELYEHAYRADDLNEKLYNSGFQNTSWLKEKYKTVGESVAKNEKRLHAQYIREIENGF